MRSNVRSGPRSPAFSSTPRRSSRGIDPPRDAAPFTSGTHHAPPRSIRQRPPQLHHWKPALKALDGQPFPESFTKGQQLAQLHNAVLEARDSFVGFRKHGASGIEISDLFPHIARQADRLCVLPGRFQGILFQSKGDAVHYIGNPEDVCQSTQRQVVDEVRRLNGFLGEEQNDPDIATRIAQYEIAFCMQASVPELTDFSGETRETLDLYGVKEPGEGSFASNCLLATVLALLGIDHHRLTTTFQGLDVRLTGIAGKVV
ncbi:MAG: DUF1501 domain-containing protein [Planctomycetia bacterium]|nr:DUF1501 domain-containing protein [Planctomycetia bacterium]